MKKAIFISNLFMYCFCFKSMGQVAGFLEKVFCHDLVYYRVYYNASYNTVSSTSVLVPGDYYITQNLPVIGIESFPGHSGNFFIDADPVGFLVNLPAGELQKYSQKSKYTDRYSSNRNLFLIGLGYRSLRIKKKDGYILEDNTRLKIVA